MQIVVVTGVSGSGKTTALRTLEDMGFYAIDNLPFAMLHDLLEFFQKQDVAPEQLALVVDARGAEDLDALPPVLESVRAAGHQVDVLYLDASDAAVRRRYSETRRIHPFAGAGSVETGIKVERALLAAPMRLATWTLDSGDMSSHDLRRAVVTLFDTREGAHRMAVTVLSFGFKHGLPAEADLVFDVRFLSNPYFVPGLRASTGQDEPCSDYVFGQSATSDFLGLLKPLLEFLTTQYEAEGKAYLTIAFGCTGGRHRSVALAEHMTLWFEEQGRSAATRHRDMPISATSKEL